MNPASAHATPLELFKVLEKSGLNVPLGTGISKSAISNQAVANDPVIKQRKDEYSQKIQRLANVDAEVQKTFGQGGQYALENPMDRERIAGQRHNAGLKEAKLSLDQADNREDEIKQKVDTIFDLHSQLIAETKAATSKSKKSEAQKLKEYADLDLAEQAGVYDPFAQQVFLTAPVAFQKWWLRELLGGLQIPKGGYTQKQVKQALSNYNAEIARTKSQTSAPKESKSKSGGFRF